MGHVPRPVASTAASAEPPLALAAAPTEALPSGALDALFAEAGSDGANEIDLAPRGRADEPPAAEVPEDEAPAGPEGMAWLLTAPLLALGADEARALPEERG